METNTITIVGMQRTGVSIALALRDGALDFTVIGHDSRASNLREKTVKEAFDRTESDLINACEPADIIVLAMPAMELENTLRMIGGRIQEHTLIIDLTALKGPGVEFAKEYLQTGHYIGARPVFAASTFADLQPNSYAARSDLFKNSVFCVMPTADTDPDAVETAVRFGGLLGAVPYFVDPVEYDLLSLGVETMPYAAAAALFHSVTQTKGWRDILRFADLPFAVGTLPLDSDAEDMVYHLLHDREATVRWLEGLVADLSELSRFVREGDQEILSAYLSELGFARDKWLEERSENDWDEVDADEIPLPSLGEQFLGGLASRGKKKS